MGSPLNRIEVETVKVKFSEAVYDGSARYEAGSEHDIQDAKRVDELKQRGLVTVVDETNGAGGDRIPCPHCEKTYATEETLAKHIAEKHPER